jgi:hypothetical protein
MERAVLPFASDINIISRNRFCPGSFRTCIVYLDYSFTSTHCDDRFNILKVLLFFGSIDNNRTGYAPILLTLDQARVFVCHNLHHSKSS